MTGLSRRQFLKVAAAVLAVSQVPVTFAHAAPSEPVAPVVPDGAKVGKALILPMNRNILEDKDFDWWQKIVQPRIQEALGTTDPKRLKFSRFDSGFIHDLHTFVAIRVECIA